MKRYLTSYSKGKLTVRDRVTNQAASESFVDADTAEIIQSRIKEVNYTVGNKKSKVTKLSPEECQEWLNSIKKEFKPEYGWINPDKIKWHKEEVKQTIKNIENSIQQLNSILGLED